MKTTALPLKRLAAAGLVLLGSSTFAQSRVTLSGVVDQYVGFSKSGATRYTQLQDGGNSASQLAVSGVEDLGSGMKTRFLLDGGLYADTGVGTLSGPGFAFTRQSWMALDANWGTVSLGKQYTPMHVSGYEPDAFGLNALTSPYNLVLGTGGQKGLYFFQSRAVNSLSYITPASSPVKVNVMYAPGEATDGSAKGDILSGHIGYKPTDKLFAGYSVQVQKAPQVAAGAMPLANSTFQSAHAIYYVKPELKMGLSFITSKADGSNRAKIWVVTGNYDMPSASSSVLAGFGRRTVDNADGFNQNYFTLGYNYYLSKRTSLYGRFVRISNAGSNFSYVGYGGVISPIVGLPGSNDGVRSLMLGIRHAF
ncbi:MAG: porin [Acidovorax sp.]